MLFTLICKSNINDATSRSVNTVSGHCGRSGKQTNSMKTREHNRQVRENVKEELPWICFDPTISMRWWPSQSPDVNPIVDLWQNLETSKQALSNSPSSIQAKTHPRRLLTLTEVIFFFLQIPTTHFIFICIKHLSKRLRDVNTSPEPCSLAPGSPNNH